MKGTRPLDNTEIRLVSACFTGMFEVRNRGLFMLGVSTGGRISELLSLTIGDVYQNRKAVAQVKGGTYTHPRYDLSVPVLQIYEIQNHFRDTPPRLPFGERAVL